MLQPARRAVRDSAGLNRTAMLMDALGFIEFYTCHALCTKFNAQLEGGFGGFIRNSPNPCF